VGSIERYDPAAQSSTVVGALTPRDVIVVGGYDESIRASADVLRISLDPPRNQGRLDAAEANRHGNDARPMVRPR
jgi:hypothetical protein